MPDEPDNSSNDESKLAAMGPYSNLDINVEELLEESVEDLTDEVIAETEGALGTELEEMDLSDSLDDLPNADDLDIADEDDFSSNEETIDTSVLLDEGDDEDPLDLDIEKLMAPGPASNENPASWEEQPDLDSEAIEDTEETIRVTPDRQAESPPMLYEVDSGQSESTKFQIPAGETSTAPAVPKAVMILAGLVILMVIGMGATLGLALQGAQSEREKMAHDLSSLRQMTASTAQSNSGKIEERVDHLSEQLSLLAHQLGELREASTSNSSVELDSIDQRLQKLESSIDGINKQPPKKTTRVKPAKEIKTPAKIEKAGWVINLMSFVKRVNAAAMTKKLLAQGYAAGHQTAEVNGRQWYRVFVSGYPSRTKAVSAQKKLASKLKISNSWVEFHRPGSQ